MDTLSQTMAELRKEGYTEDFNVQTDCISCKNGELRVHPEDFSIDKYFRFEGESNPSDESVLYAISSEKHNVKGLLVNALGIYADDTADQIAKALNIHRHD